MLPATVDVPAPAMPAAEDVENSETGNSRPLGDGTVRNERQVSILSLYVQQVHSVDT